MAQHQDPRSEIAYPILRSVSKYLQVERRSELVRAVKSLRNANKKIPRYIKDLEIIQYAYQLSITLDGTWWSKEGSIDDDPVVREEFERFFAHYLDNKETCVENMFVNAILFRGLRCAARIKRLELPWQFDKLTANMLIPFLSSEHIGELYLEAESVEGTEWISKLSEIKADVVKIRLENAQERLDLLGKLPFRCLRITLVTGLWQTCVDMGRKFQNESYDIESRFHLCWGNHDEIVWDRLIKTLQPEMKTDNVLCARVPNPKHELLVKRDIFDGGFNIHMEIVERGSSVFELVTDHWAYRKAISVLKPVHEYFEFYRANTTKEIVLTFLIYFVFAISHISLIFYFHFFT